MKIKRSITGALLAVGLATSATPFALARDMMAIDIASLGGEPLSADEFALFEGSWAEISIYSEVKPENESERNEACKYGFGMDFMDNTPSEDLEEMSALVSGLKSAKGQLFIAHNEKGPVIAEEGVWSTSVKAGDVHRIVPVANGWFDVGFYSAVYPEKTAEGWYWKQVGSLEEGQVFKNAIYRIRLMPLPSGTVAPIMQDVTFGIPTGFLERNKYYIRCEDYQTSNVE